MLNHGIFIWMVLEKIWFREKVEKKTFDFWHIASAAGAVFCFLIVVGVTPDAFTSVSAAKSLLNGEAQAYRAQEQERVAIFRGCFDRKCRVERISK